MKQPIIYREYLASLCTLTGLWSTGGVELNLPTDWHIYSMGVILGKGTHSWQVCKSRNKDYVCLQPVVQPLCCLRSLLSKVNTLNRLQPLMGVFSAVRERAAEWARGVWNNHYSNVLSRHSSTWALLSFHTKVAVISVASSLLWASNQYYWGCGQGDSSSI